MLTCATDEAKSVVAWLSILPEMDVGVVEDVRMKVGVVEGLQMTFFVREQVGQVLT